VPQIASELNQAGELQQRVSDQIVRHLERISVEIRREQVVIERQEGAIGRVRVLSWPR
jgi:stress response protein YsnF